MVIDVASLVTLFVTLFFSGVVLNKFADTTRVTRRLTTRFVYGIPWGSTVILTALIAIYVIVQGGLEDGGPIVVAFRSWSLWYPDGIFLSTFTHLSSTHLRGNLLWAVLFLPLVEYLWGHYGNPARTSGTSVLQTRAVMDWLAIPIVRIAVFIAAVLGYGVGSSVFLPGATIGFSGVVFVCFGVVVINVPRAAIAGVVVVEPIRLLSQAVGNPIVTAVAGPEYVTPSWANVSLHGHLFGFLVGIFIGVALLRYRQAEHPDFHHVWFATLLLAVTHSLYAFVWPAGPQQYVLFQAVGAAVVLILATLTALLTIQEDRIFIPQIDLSSRETAFGLLVCAIFAFSVIGIGYNLATVTVTGDDMGNEITIEDYTVWYGEDLENQYTTAFTSPVSSGDASANTSGVIVASDTRNAWHVAVSTAELRRAGTTTVPVGGVTWREEITVVRTHWSLAGSGDTYRVYGEHDGKTQVLHYSNAVPATSQINGQIIGVNATKNGYDVIVISPDGTRYAKPVPEPGETVQVNNLVFERTERQLFARSNDTRVHIGTYYDGSASVTSRTS